MWRVAIVGSVNDDFLNVAKKRLSDRNVYLEKFNVLLPNPDYDAILVFPDTDLSLNKYSCRILIIPDVLITDEAIIKNASALCVISYGLSPKNTVTLSSTNDHRNVVALQRDIISLDNSLILRQEFTLDCDLSHYETTALASLMAISGVLEQ
ncbi:MAG: hypothetical protein ACOX1Q_03460 [Eubacteriales bacterium]